MNKQAALVRKLRKATRHYNKYDETNAELMENLLLSCIEELTEVVHPDLLCNLQDTVLVYYFKLWTNYVVSFPEYEQRLPALIKGVSFYLRDPGRVQQELAQEELPSASNVLEFQ